MLSLTCDGTTIGLIVRGKVDATANPLVTRQHAGCILPHGSPIGCFSGRELPMWTARMRDDSARERDALREELES